MNFLLLSLLLCVANTMAVTSVVDVKAVNSKISKMFSSAVRKHNAKHDAILQANSALSRPVVSTKSQNLRSESASVSLEATNQYVKENGFYEQVLYSVMSTEGQCQKPWSKLTYAINTCVSSVQNPGNYAMKTAYANPQGELDTFCLSFLSFHLCFFFLLSFRKHLLRI
jgi:hypothetical protein